MAPESNCFSSLTAKVPSSEGGRREGGGGAKRQDNSGYGRGEGGVMFVC